MQTIIGHSSIRIEALSGKRNASLLVPSHTCAAVEIRDADQFLTKAASKEVA